MNTNGLRYSGEWCSQEFSVLELGDSRLNERFIMTAERLFASPESSVNQACVSWSESKAAYRLFDNEKVTPDKIIEAHQSLLLKRVVDHKLVLAIQDTTYFNFDSRPDGYAVATKKKFNDMHGIVMHHALAITPEGLHLGIFYQQLYNRNIGTLRKGHYDHQSIPFEDKESYRWVLALRESLRFEEEGVKVVTVGDRESDIFEFMHEADLLKASYVIRAAKDRSLWSGKNRNEPSEKLWETLESQPIKGHFEVFVSKQKDRKERTTKVTVQFAKILLRPPYRTPSARSENLEPLEPIAILVKEQNPPDGEDGLEWMLLTDTDICTG
jgi:hypothetical protein